MDTTQFKYTISKEISDAMKSGNKVRLETLRSINNAITVFEKNNPDKAVDYLNVVQSLAKQRKQSIEAYTKAGNKELAANEQAELDILNAFLPQAMSKQEIEIAIDRIINDSFNGELEQKDMGTVISLFKQQHGHEDMKVVSTITKSKIKKLAK